MLALAALLIAAPALQADSNPNPNPAASVMLGLPPMDHDEATDAQRELGRRLFFDRRLSFNGTMSCSMCHVPEQGFGSTASRTAMGIEGRSLPRNAPTLLNVGWVTRLFHDGRENSLATQAWAPLLNPLEMANPSVGFVLERLSGIPEYRDRFLAAYGSSQPTMSGVGEALQAFERSLVAAGSRFDRWRYAAEADALSAVEQAGYRLFVGKAGCSACHLVGERFALFTDQGYYATGASLATPEGGAHQVALSSTTTVEVADVELAAFVAPAATDLGRFEITLDPADRFAFRTPTLRNIERTAPYMHDGSLADLEAVVSFYDQGGKAVPNKSALVRPLHLTAPEQRALVAFLKALTSPAVDTLPAQLRAE